MITHTEAQALLSERLDAPLDPYVNDVLEAHLASCYECRAFAASSGYLATSLHAMPLMPASAAVRQNVWAAIERQQHSWWRQFVSAMTGQTAAVVSTAAVALIVIAFASVAILRLVDTNGGDDDPETRLAAGTQEGIALATESAEPSATDVATEEQAEPTTTRTEAPTEPSGGVESVATTEPSSETTEPTATSQPTELPTDAPVATEPPDTVPPTATEAPAETEAAEATSPPDDSATSQAFSPAETSDEGPTDLTGRSIGSPTAESGSAVDNLVIFDPGSLLATAESSLDRPVPSPTVVPATPTPEPPTETPEPSPTPEPPTETSEPSPTPEPPTETPEPSPTSEPPTETPEPSPTPEPPTETPAPPTPTSEPTSVSSTDAAPTSPPIEPMDGSDFNDSSRTSATATPAEPESTGEDDRSGGDTTGQIIEAIGPQSGSGSDGDNTSREDDTGPDNQVIEPVDDGGSQGTGIGGASDDPQGPGSESDTTTDDDGGETTEGDVETGDSDAFTLSDADFYSDGTLWGSPDDRLGFDDGVIFSNNPDGYSLGRDDVEVQAIPDDQGQSIAICDDGGECVDATSDSANGPHTDEPIGWVDGRLIYQRIGNGNGEPVEIRAVEWNGEPISDEALGAIDNPIDPLGAAYPVDAGTLIPASSSWLLISDGSARITGQNPYGDIQLVRANFGDDLITYVAGGQVIVAPASSPGDALSSIPFNGVDYDLSERNQAVVS